MEAEITGAEPPKRHQSPGAVRGDAQVPERLSLRGLVACLLCQLQCLLQEGGRGSGVRRSRCRTADTLRDRSWWTTQPVREP